MNECLLGQLCLFFTISGMLSHLTNVAQCFFPLLLVVCMCLFPYDLLVFFSLSPHPFLPISPARPPSALPSSSSHSADSMQAKVAEHRRMLRESDKTGHRPRIKGRFGTHAEQLRNWLGEYLLAKYDLTCQINPQREIAGYATHA